MYKRNTLWNTTDDIMDKAQLPIFNNNNAARGGGSHLLFLHLSINNKRHVRSG